MRIERTEPDVLRFGGVSVPVGETTRFELAFNKREIDLLERAEQLLANARVLVREHFEASDQYGADAQGNVWYDYETWSVDQRLGLAEAGLYDVPASLLIDTEQAGIRCPA